MARVGGRRGSRSPFPSLQANIIAPDTSRPEESRADEVLRSHNRLNLHPYRDGYRGKCPVHGGGGSTCTKGEGQKLVSPLCEMRVGLESARPFSF